MVKVSVLCMRICVVPHASPMQCPGVNEVHVPTYNNIPECPLYGDCHVHMAVERVEVVFVVVDSSVKVGESTKLHFYYGMEAAE